MLCIINEGIQIHPHITESCQLNMDATELLSVVFMFQILTSETIAWEETLYLLLL